MVVLRGGGGGWGCVAGATATLLDAVAVDVEVMAGPLERLSVAEDWSVFPHPATNKAPANSANVNKAFRIGFPFTMEPRIVIL